MKSVSVVDFSNSCPLLCISFVYWKMKYKTAEKDESMIINSDEYKRLKIENESENIAVKDKCNANENDGMTVNQPTPIKFKNMKNNINTIPQSLPPRRVSLCEEIL